MRGEGGSRNAEPREDGARLFGRGRENGMKFIGERVRHHGLDVMNGSRHGISAAALAPLPVALADTKGRMRKRSNGGVDLTRDFEYP